MKKLMKKFGFTLIETLVVIGVIAVLCGISIPGIIQAKRSLDIVEANSTAKELFVAAQNRLTSMKADGQLSDVLNKMNEQALIDAETIDTEKKAVVTNLYYQSTGDNALKEYLLTDTIFSNVEGSYVVEINPFTGDIQSVFYWTNDEDLGQIYLNGKNDGEKVIEALINMSEDERETLVQNDNARIGYYSSNGTTAASGIQQFDPEVKVINGTDLYLSIIQSGFSTIPNFDINKLFISLVFEDEHGNKNEIEASSEETLNEFTKTFDGDTLELYFLLDSCDFDSFSFGKIDYMYKHNADGSRKAGFALCEGDNIKITVTFKYEGDNNLRITSTPAKGTASFNSLFGSKTNISDAESETTDITIWNIRHLRNLAKITVNGEDSPYAGRDITITQTLDIDGNPETWTQDGTNELSSIIPTSFRDITSFNKIAPINLHSSIASINAIAASGVHTISNIVLTGNGLFTNLNGCYISGLTIVDPIFEISGKPSNLGVIAGTADNCHFFKCGVYSTGSSPITFEGNEYVGGIAGKLSGNSTVTSCYANVNAKGSKYVGGLFGETASTVTVTNCYTSGKATGTSHIGGFIGHINNSKVYNCFTTSDVNGKTDIGGFVGAVDLLSVTTGAKLIVGNTYTIKNDGTDQYLKFNNEKKNKATLSLGSEEEASLFEYNIEYISATGYVLKVNDTNYHLCNKNGNISNNSSWQMLLGAIEYNGKYFIVSLDKNGYYKTFMENEEQINQDIRDAIANNSTDAARKTAVNNVWKKYGMSNTQYLTVNGSEITWSNNFSLSANITFTIEGESLYKDSPIIQDCYSYGTVNESATSIDKTSVGGFTVNKYDNAFKNCFFLRDTGYNDVYDEKTEGGIQSETIADWHNAENKKPMIMNNSSIIMVQGLEYSSGAGAVEIDRSSNIKFYWGNVPSFMKTTPAA